MRTRALGAALLLSIAATSSLSRAQTAADVAAARDLFVEGAALAKKGDWEAATDRYARSLKLKRAAITLYSLGVAEKHQGKLVEALEHLRAFLAEPSGQSTATYVAPARQAVTELEGRVSRVTIVVKPRPDDVTVTLDGDAVPREALEVPRIVNPGKHVLSASAKGYTEGHAEVNVAEGGSGDVTLELQTAPAVPTDPLVPTAALGEKDHVLDGGASAAPSRALPIGLFVAGGAMIAGGVAVGLVGVKEANDAPTRDGDDAKAAKTKAVVGDVVAIAGVATAGIGLVVLLARKPKSSTTSGWFVAPRGAGFRF